MILNHTYKKWFKWIKKTVTYEVISESGPAHDKTFVVHVLVDGLVFGIGTGKSKKEAEQNAATDAIKKIA